MGHRNCENSFSLSVLVCTYSNPLTPGNCHQTRDLSSLYRGQIQTQERVERGYPSIPINKKIAIAKEIDFLEGLINAQWEDVILAIGNSVLHLNRKYAEPARSDEKLATN